MDLAGHIDVQALTCGPNRSIPPLASIGEAWIESPVRSYRKQEEFLQVPIAFPGQPIWHWPVRCWRQAGPLVQMAMQSLADDSDWGTGLALHPKILFHRSADRIDGAL